jgi:hypothetical protein
MALSEIIETVEARASVLCAQCLRDEITVRAAAFNEIAARLAVAERARYTAPDGEEQYDDAFGEALAALAIIAVFTVELTKCPPDTAVVVSLN